MTRETLGCYLWLLLLAGCLEIDNVAQQELDAGSTDSASSDSGIDISDFDAGPCANACLADHPTAREKFLTMSACVQRTPTGACAESCGDNPTGPETPTCTELGVLSTIANCNACVKDTCCELLGACLSDAECFATSLCSSTCDDAPAEQ